MEDITDNEKTELEWVQFNLKDKEITDITYMKTILMICKKLQRLEKEIKQLSKERDHYKSETEQLELMMTALTD